MNLDKTTLSDLSFLTGDHAVFNLINRCTTQMGTEALRQQVLNPPATYGLLKAQQDAVRFWEQHLDQWPKGISNGTLVMLEKFYESADMAATRPNAFGLMISSLMQRLFDRNEYSFIRFSVSHLIDFLKGCDELIALLEWNPPEPVLRELELFKSGLELPLCQALIRTDAHAKQSTLLDLSYHARREIKHLVRKMMAGYARLDALQSMARATREHNWSLPDLLPPDQLSYQAQGLYHPLLQRPVAYDIAFAKDQNFLFLTGANMSGKSTLIRAMGLGALLAHLGMGVPAKGMTISFLEGIITNMHVEDNIILGESYFFAEVQRMKMTAQKLNRNRYHLVLMDELFKGTNVHDAYECSRAVIEGLLTHRDNLMALSTHLNELSENIKTVPNVVFRYCYTRISEAGQYEFTYQLKEGVSKDRIGYLVLKQEGVLDLLKRD
ncbi:MutS-related protein [Taibaiella chishuiensis]|uniref:MutS-like protein n=1 Tax=Taibaiella chishuiensis TaxID=1434707 RepID=A0A2P8DBC9_9BACT|nr:DNA mismatch repair protein MutS [Taibaiella chishuiensis]PSK94531.1 MutS-like protein [Taibaiella chishuiensis]